MTDYAELIAKLAEAKEGTSELDALIVACLNDALLKPYPPQTDFGPSNRWQFWSLDGAHFLGNEGATRFKVERLTTSVDAILALIEKRGWRLYTVDASIPDRFSVFLKGPDRLWPATEDSAEIVGPGWETGTAKTLPAALCSAILTALQAQEATSRQAP